MNYLAKYLIGGVLLLISCSISGQTIINTYTKVTNIPSCNSCAGDCNQLDVLSAAGFSAGDRVLVIQMKGASLTLNNDSTFGSISAYGSAGNFEKMTIASIAGNTVTFTGSLARNYDVTGRVQMVSVPQFVNYTVPAGGLTGQPWDGDVGGIIALEVTGTLTLNGDIFADSIGFRGGALTVRPNGTLPYPCATDGYYFPSSDYNLGNTKGEGIADSISGFTHGKGPWANGGGGGNSHNGGGGGGSNQGRGGYGAQEYGGCPPAGNDTATYIPRGIGGNTVDFQGGNKIFLGGGGGAGHENNSAGTPGANGGGIIMIEATTIAGNGFTIRANGDGANQTKVFDPNGNDGAGGGGAGGSIKLEVINYAGNLTVEAIGGKGGNVDDCASCGCHPPGGGGGGGLICATVGTLPGTVTTDVSGGAPGILVSNADCLNEPYGATNGDLGTVYLNCLSSATPPPPQISVNLGPDVALCDPVTATLDTKLPTTNYTFSWYVNGAGSVSADSSYFVNTPGEYVVQVQAAGCPDAYDTVTITTETSLPVDTVFCSTPADVDLSVQGSGGYQWYDAPVGGMQVGIGDTYTATGVTGTVTYYVEDTTQQAYGGFTPETQMSGFNTRTGGSNTYSGFNASVEFTIDTVSVFVRTYNTNLDNMDIELRQCGNPPLCNSGTSTLIASKTVLVQGPCNCTQDFEFRFPLGFTVPPGQGYFLAYSNGAVNAHWDGGGTTTCCGNPNYSYTAPGIVEIYGPVDGNGQDISAWAGGSYGFFYDWAISTGIQCERIPVSATLDCTTPVDWLSFNAVVAGRDVQLEWKTLTEENNSHYEVQRSADGFAFETIGQLDGKGTTNLLSVYSFTDTKPYTGVSYYRIVQFDDDGTKSYSIIRTVERQEDFIVTIKPNPFDDNITVNVPGIHDVDVVIRDILGKVLYSGQIKGNAEVINLQVLSGLYFIEVRVEGKKVVSKLLKE